MTQISYAWIALVTLAAAPALGQSLSFSQGVLTSPEPQSKWRTAALARKSFEKDKRVVSEGKGTNSMLVCGYLSGAAECVLFGTSAPLALAARTGSFAPSTTAWSVRAPRRVGAMGTHTLDRVDGSFACGETTQHVSWLVVCEAPAPSCTRGCAPRCAHLTFEYRGTETPRVDADLRENGLHVYIDPLLTPHGARQTWEHNYSWATLLDHGPGASRGHELYRVNSSGSPLVRPLD